MKQYASFIRTLILMVIIAALYRIIPNRQPGFAPQIAMALFAGAVIRDKKWAFALPILSMMISDLLYHFLYIQGLTEIRGFYSGQAINYLLFASMTAIGFFMKKINIKNIFIFSLITPTVYFILSNFYVWITGSGFNRPKTFEGLMMCYGDALPFFRNSVIATVLFSAILFGVWRLAIKDARGANWLWLNK
ncbi:MAG: hypothetical protein JNL51_14325 [Chitinophagaceae bacterium]|nr:hypothetical protein [Chitinophagaceae bacterium]